MTPLTKDEFISRFNATKSQRLVNISTHFLPVHEEKTVSDVVSVEVCIVLCTDPELSQLVNAWTYDYESQLCSCVWLDPAICDYDNVTDNRMPDNETISDGLTAIAYVHLAKIVPCSKHSIH